MRLTKFTDLALRVVMRLAVMESGTVMTTKAVAEAMAVPYTHTAKAITRLQHLGVIEARRGHGGGLALSDFGRTASLGWLVRRLEGEAEVVECEGETPCPLRAACRLRGALREAQRAFYRVLDQLTIDDLVASPMNRILLAIK